MINYIIGIAAVLIVAAVVISRIKAFKEGKSGCGCSECGGGCPGCQIDENSQNK